MPVQRGFAMIAILALIALISAFLIASALNRTPADVSNEREQRNMDTLRQAKAALIAYAANEQWQAYKSQGTDQPGALPCPDIVHDGTETEEGDSDCIALGFSNTTNLIGRIPWKTLGIDDLRDASGERIWYALAHNFRKLSGTTVINSDTQACDTPACGPGEAQLTVTGTAPAKNVVAIVFAPGPALNLQQFGGPLQTRPTDHTDAEYNNPINYLENFSLGDGAHYTFTTNANPVENFNDRLLVITQAELMAAVEPAVAARIERDVKPLLLTDYFATWGRYPFAVPFVSPSTQQVDYVGVDPQTRGLLPVTNNQTFTWTNATVTQIGNFNGSANPSIVTSSSCTISSLNVSCIVNFDVPSPVVPSSKSDHDARPVIKVEVFPSSNVRIAFAALSSPPTPPGDFPFVMHEGDGSFAQFSGPPWGFWSPSGPPPTVAMVGGVLTYTGWLNDAHDMDHQARITFPLPAIAYPPRFTNPSTISPNIAWFIANQWYRQTYYAVAPALVPTGGGDCGFAPPCLTVNNLPSPNGKQAILVFAGRALDGQSRTPPSGNPKDYLEGDNCKLLAGKDLDIGSTPPTCNLTLTGTDYVYEHRSGPSPTINDRVVVVAP